MADRPGEYRLCINISLTDTSTQKMLADRTGCRARKPAFAKTEET
jgi:hypothetical protein